MSHAIAYQGAPGAFSHQASIKFANEFLRDSHCELLPLKHFSELFLNAEKSFQDKEVFACLPIDNSTIGSISENYDLLWPSKLKILSEFYLPIHHQLLSIEGAKVEEIEEVYSHPAALEQCRRLFQRFPKMQEHTYYDTGAASKMVQEKNNPKIASIGSLQAAKEYSLSIILPDIEDYPQNQTRFVLVGKANGLFLLRQPKFPCRFSFAFEGTRDLNQLTALSTLLGEFIQLHKIESRPIPEAPWHYRIFVDLIVMQGHTDRLASSNSPSEPLSNATDGLEDQIKSLIPAAKFFGVYNNLVVNS